MLFTISTSFIIFQVRYKIHIINHFKIDLNPIVTCATFMHLTFTIFSSLNIKMSSVTFNSRSETLWKMTEAETKVNEVRNQQNLSADRIVSSVNDIVSQENVPVWLNKDFLTKYMQKYFGGSSNFCITRMIVKSLGGNGDSFASLMFRVILDYSIGNKETKTLSVVVKTLPLIEIALERLGSKNYNVQNKEMEMYFKIIPRMKELLKDAGENTDFVPECYGIDTKHSVMLLEDLALSKFVMACRVKRLDLEHTLLGLRLLARMHAASAYMIDENKETFKLFKHGFFSRGIDGSFDILFESICDAFVDEVSTWDGYEYYAKKLPSVRRNLIEYAQRSFDCDDEDFLVLNHGDLWTTNLMWQYNENCRPTDVKMIDFQYSWVGSPALDLIVSMKLNIKKHLIKFHSVFLIHINN
jgi:hypothetical protein